MKICQSFLIRKLQSLQYFHHLEPVMNMQFVQQEIREELEIWGRENGLESPDLLHFVCGTKPYDDYPKAEAYFGQFNAISANDHLGKDIYYDHLPEFEVPFINTATLGEAFEPEQRFEAPDGSPLLFDRDFLGNKREAATIPGPFACGEKASALR